MAKAQLSGEIASKELADLKKSTAGATKSANEEADKEIQRLKEEPLYGRKKDALSRYYVLSH